MVSSCGLSSAGSALVESSNCKVFALNRGLVTDIIPAAFLELEWKCSAFHSIKAVVSQVGALLLLNKYIIATPSGKHPLNHCEQNILAILIFGC